MAYETALSPSTLSTVNSYLRQLRATGRPVSARDMREAYTAALTAEAKTNLQNRQLAKQNEQWEKQYALNQQYAQMAQDRNTMMKDAYETQKSSDTIKGIGSLVLAGPKMLSGLKSMKGTVSDWFNLGETTPGAAEVAGGALEAAGGSMWSDLPDFSTALSGASTELDIGSTAFDLADFGISAGDVGEAATSLLDMSGAASSAMDAFSIADEGESIFDSILGGLF